MSVSLYKKSSVNNTSSALAELDDLQRQYRQLDKSNSMTAIGSNNIIGPDDNTNLIRIQRQQIDKLKRDNDRLKTDLALETRQARLISNNQINAGTIAKLQDEGDNYTRRIELEKKRIIELDQSIQKLQSSILELRRNTGGINSSRESNQSIQKQIKILENRLDKSLVKFNESLAHNKSLRETIDNLRRERLVFDGIYRKLEKELNDKKSEMTTILNNTKLAYDQRQAANIEMYELKLSAEMEHTAFESQWNSLGELIEQDREMKLTIKSKEIERTAALFRIASGADSDSNNNNPQSSNDESSSATGAGDSAGTATDNDELKLKKKLTKGIFTIASDRNSINEAQLKVNQYEEAFAKIQKHTKINDIDELVELFISAEDQNFQLFNTVNSLSNEIELKSESIQSIESEIQKIKQAESSNHHNNSNNTGNELGNNSNTVDHTRRQLLDELTNQLTQTSITAAAYESRYNHAMRTVSSLKGRIGDIYTLLNNNNNNNNNIDSNSSNNTNTNSNSELLSITGDTTISEGNMLQYLGLIESCTNSLLTKYVQLRESELNEERLIESERELINKYQLAIAKKQSNNNNTEDNEDSSTDELDPNNNTNHNHQHNNNKDINDSDEDDADDTDNDKPPQHNSTAYQQPISIKAPSVQADNDTADAADDEEDYQPDTDIINTATTNTNNTNTEKPMTREELEAEIAALRADETPTTAAVTPADESKSTPTATLSPSAAPINSNSGAATPSSPEPVPATESDSGEQRM